MEVETELSINNDGSEEIDISHTSEDAHSSKKKNYKRYKQRYTTAWENLPLFRGWLSGSQKGEYHYYCMACDITGICGKSEIVRHAKSVRHINNNKAMPKKKKNRSEKDEQSYYCKICDKKFQAVKATLSLHKKSVKHLKALKGEQEPEDAIIKIAKSNAAKSSPVKYKMEIDFGNDEEFDSPQPFSKSLESAHMFQNTPHSTTTSFRPARGFSTNPRIERKINTADGSFVIVQSDQSLFPPSSPTAVTYNGTSLSKFSADIANAFREDLEKFLSCNDSFYKSVIRNENFSSGDTGLGRLTRVMVSQMANQYLMEYTVDSFKNDCPDTKRHVASRLNALEQTMASSVSALRTMKAEFENRDDMLQTGITVHGLDFDELCDS